MKTTVAACAERHCKLMLRAEQESLAQRTANPQFTLAHAVTGLVARVRRAIARRGIAAVFAVQCAHPACTVRSTDENQTRKTRS